MARIRSIKPEFTQSETIGRLSRDARLLFIQLWTIVDDDGRTRAASRMLASLLYPYDDDAPKLIDRWLIELEDENCIRRYESDGSQYLEIVNWLKHQKIDRPTPSKLPSFDAGSPLARDSSRVLDADLDRGRDQDQGRGSSSLRSDARARRDAINREFAATFWPAFPHKVQRGAAVKAWPRAREKASLDEIMAGLERYIRAKPPDRQWQNPATFLNGESWNDEPAEPPVSRSQPASHDAVFRGLADAAEARSRQHEREAMPDGGDHGFADRAGDPGDPDSDLEIPGFLRRTG